MSSQAANSRRTVVDAIHGTIRPDGPEWRVIDTATFQRLRHIKQLGLGHVTYPNATHTRFAHSLGVFHIMSRVVKEAKDLDLRQEDVAELRLAALLHDIGHYPYSHLMETVDRVVLTEERVSRSDTKKLTVSPSASKGYPNHEDLGRLIITVQKDMLDALGGRERAERIADLFTRTGVVNPRHSLLIHSSFDMDRLDYLVRDARFAGVPYGEIDFDYLLQNVRASKSQIIGIEHKAMAAAEQFLFARYFMHKAVYYHKTTFGLEEAFRQLLRRCRNKKLFEIPLTGDEIREIARAPRRLLEFTDAFLDRIANKAVHDPDPIIRHLAKAIVFRRPPKLLREACALVDLTNVDSQKYNACTYLINSCVSNLASLSRKHDVPLELFMLAEPSPIQLEKRGALVSASKAVRGSEAVEGSKEQVEPSEKEEELIKAFEKKRAVDPKSLVDIPASILNTCAHRSLRIVRLYVVEEDESKFRRLEREADAW